MRKLAHALLLVFVFAVPWEQSFVVPGWGVGNRLIGLAAACVAVVAVLGEQGRMRRATPFHTLLALFVVLSIASTLWTHYPGPAIVRAKTYAQLAVMVWLIWEFTRDVGAVRRVLGAYVLGAGVSVAGTLGALQRAGEAVGEARFAAFGYNPNELGITMAFAIPMAWYLSLSSRNRVFTWAWRLMLPAVILAVVATGSRGAMITACAALLVIPLSLMRVRSPQVAIAGPLVLFLVYLGWEMIPDATIMRLGTAPQEILTGRFGGRGEIWQAGLQVFTENPVIGVGAGGFHYAVAPLLGGPRSSHNLYLGFLVESGIIGSLLLLAAVVYLLRQMRRLPPLERLTWGMVLSTLAVASFTISFGGHKQTWLLLGATMAHARMYRASGLTRPRRARAHCRVPRHLHGGPRAGGPSVPGRPPGRPTG